MGDDGRVGFALVALVSMYGFVDATPSSDRLSYDVARPAAQVVSGAGSLGAGTLWRKGRRGERTPDGGRRAGFIIG